MEDGVCFCVESAGNLVALTDLIDPLASTITLALMNRVRHLE